MVHFKDDTVCFVPDRDLVELILSDSIVAFRRGAEWVSPADASIKRHAAARKNGKGNKGVDARGRVWRRFIVTNAG